MWDGRHDGQRRLLLQHICTHLTYVYSVPRQWWRQRNSTFIFDSGSDEEGMYLLIDGADAAQEQFLERC